MRELYPSMKMQYFKCVCNKAWTSKRSYTPQVCRNCDKNVYALEIEEMFMRLNPQVCKGILFFIGIEILIIIYIKFMN